MKCYMNKENILFIIHHMSNGGAERTMSYLTLGFEEQKYNKILVVDNRKEIEYDFNAKIISLDLYTASNLFYKILNNLIRMYKIFIIKRKYKIKKSISLLENPNVINILTKRNDRVIVSVRNCKSKEEKKLSNIRKKLIQLIYNRADKIIAISEGVKLDLIDCYNINENKIEVIYNTIDTNFIEAKKNMEIEDEIKNIFEYPVLINSGRLTEQKGQINLIRAFKKVVDYNSKINLIILGQGEMEATLRKEISKLNLEKNIHLLGYKDNPFKYISKSNIFILSSLYEGFGNVLLEALACGTPVISTDCKYGPREILSPGTSIEVDIDSIEYGEYGILIPNFEHDVTKNEELLASVIIEMLNNQELYNSYKNKISKRVEDFNYTNTINKWKKL